MAATMKDPRTFFSKGSVEQYEFCLGLYEEAIKLKAEQKKKNSQDFLDLDRWYQNELPKKIKSRGKDAHLTHEELVKCMKWKLARGKFSPRLKDLITMNTPRLCLTETKKAFRALLKKEDLTSAIQALCNLKGVGPAMASAILTAANPGECGFMADECLLAIPEIESIDYTTRELLNFVEQLKNATNRLNKLAGDADADAVWTPHKIEQALWAHFVVADLKKELLDDMPGGLIPPPTVPRENGEALSNDASSEDKNGATHQEENTNSLDSFKETTTPTANTNGTSEAGDSRASFLSANEDTNDSLAPSEPASDQTSEVPEEVPSPMIDEDTNITPPEEHQSKKIKLDE